MTHLLIEFPRCCMYSKKVGEMLTKAKLDDFLTSVCYPHILAIEDVTAPARL